MPEHNDICHDCEEVELELTILDVFLEWHPWVELRCSVCGQDSYEDHQIPLVVYGGKRLACYDCKSILDADVEARHMRQPTGAND